MDRIKALFDITKSRLYGDSDSLKELLCAMIEHMEDMQPVQISAFVASIEAKAAELIGSLRAIDEAVKVLSDSHTSLSEAHNELTRNFLSLVERIDNIEQHPAVSIPALPVVEVLPVAQEIASAGLSGAIDPLGIYEPEKTTDLAQTLSAKNDILGA